MKRLKELPPDHEVALMTRHLQLLPAGCDESVDGESITDGASCLNDGTLSPTSMVGRVKLAPIFLPPSSLQPTPVADLANVIIGRNVNTLMTESISDGEFEEPEPNILCGIYHTEILCRMVDSGAIICDEASNVVGIDFPEMQRTATAFGKSVEKQVVKKEEEKLSQQVDPSNVTLTPVDDPKEKLVDPNDDAKFGATDSRLKDPEKWKRLFLADKLEQEKRAKEREAAAEARSTCAPPTTSRNADGIVPAPPRQVEAPADPLPPVAIDYNLDQVTLIDPLLLDPPPFMQFLVNDNEEIWALHESYMPSWDQSTGTFHQTGKIYIKLLKYSH